ESRCRCDLRSPPSRFQHDTIAREHASIAEADVASISAFINVDDGCPNQFRSALDGTCAEVAQQLLVVHIALSGEMCDEFSRRRNSDISGDLDRAFGVKHLGRITQLTESSDLRLQLRGLSGIGQLQSAGSKVGARPLKRLGEPDMFVHTGDIECMIRRVELRISVRPGEARPRCPGAQIPGVDKCDFCTERTERVSSAEPEYP